MTTSIRSSALGQTGYALRCAAMTSAGTTVTLSSSVFGRSSFSASDVGRAIQVTGAGADGADLYSTIASVGSATTATLADAASTTVTSNTAFWYPVGTDDTAAIQSAINACSADDGSVLLPDGVYVISSGLGTTD